MIKKKKVHKENEEDMGMQSSKIYEWVLKHWETMQQDFGKTKGLWTFIEVREEEDLEPELKHEVIIGVENWQNDSDGNINNDDNNKNG